MSTLMRYIEAWATNDADAIVDRVAHDCVITECDGPVYRGRSRVRQWAETWFAAGGVVHDWRVTERFDAGAHEVAQWVFECTWRGNRASFEGCSIAETGDGLVVVLREYASTAPRYDWNGTWRE